MCNLFDSCEQTGHPCTSKNKIKLPFTLIFQRVSILECWLHLEGPAFTFETLIQLPRSSYVKKSCCIIWCRCSAVIFPQSAHKYTPNGSPVELMTWWRHEMETISALLALYTGNSLVTGEFPSQRPVTRSLIFSLICALKNRLSKQSWGLWFETPSFSLWHHCNERWLGLPTVISIRPIIQEHRTITKKSQR